MTTKYIIAGRLKDLVEEQHQDKTIIAQSTEVLLHCFVFLNAF